MFKVTYWVDSIGITKQEIDAEVSFLGNSLAHRLVTNCTWRISKRRGRNRKGPWEVKYLGHKMWVSKTLKECNEHINGHIKIYNNKRSHYTIDKVDDAKI